MTNDYVEVPDLPNAEFNEDEVKEIKLPPLPVALRPWDEKNDFRYQQEDLDFRKRLTHKLYSLWTMWAIVATDQKLGDLLKKECRSKKSEEYKVKCAIIDLVDKTGKILGDTNILEELAFLTCEDEKEFLEKMKAKRQAQTEQTPTEPSE